MIELYAGMKIGATILRQEITVYQGDRKRPGFVVPCADCGKTLKRPATEIRKRLRKWGTVYCRNCAQVRRADRKALELEQVEEDSEIFPAEERYDRVELRKIHDWGYAPR